MLDSVVIVRGGEKGVVECSIFEDIEYVAFCDAVSYIEACPACGGGNLVCAVILGALFLSIGTGFADAVLAFAIL